MAETAPENSGFLHFIKRLLGLSKKKKKPLGKDDLHLEPEYWQEVIDFIDTVNGLIEIHTIHDPNIAQINHRIVDYVLYQINTKGSISDPTQRYEQLDTLLDRVLTHSFGKIVGIKHEDTSKAEFTVAVNELKKRLHERHQLELQAQRPGSPS